MVLGKTSKVLLSCFVLMILISVSVFAKPSVTISNVPTTNPNTIQMVKHLPFQGNYGPCPQDSRAASRPINGTNVTGGLTGTFPQPNNFTCLPTGLSVMIANQNITNLNATQIFGVLQNMTNNSNHMTVLVGAVVQLLNQSGANVTITVSGPYAGSNVTLGNITTTPGGHTIQIINLTNHPSPGTGTSPGGSNGGSNGGAGTGTGTGGGNGGSGGSGSTSVTGVGFIRADGSAHFILVLDSVYCEPFLQGVYYHGAVGIKWTCYITYWDPLDNKYHEGMMTMDGQWIKVNGQWAKVGDTVKVTAG